MILEKLRETLAEVDVERRSLKGKLDALTEVEFSLKAMISAMSHGVALPQTKILTIQMPIADSSETKDRIDQVIDILRAEGKPLHIKQVAERLNALNGTSIDRTRLEPGLNKHIQKVKQPRIAKFGPSYFGLPEWKASTLEPALLGKSGLLTH